MSPPALIKVGFCVAYDWELLRHSLPLVYPFADRLCLSIDRDRKSWSGHAYSWDQAGFDILIAAIDTERKITVHQDDFHRPELSPMANEVRQRLEMARVLGEGGWHVQLDTDEFVLDFAKFKRYLQGLHPRRPVNVCCPWITLFKRTPEGFLYIRNEGLAAQEYVAVATNAPAYTHGRASGHFNQFTDNAIVHLSWARSEAEITEKVRNWGHSNDLDPEAYLRKWKGLDASNYAEARDLHPLQPWRWKRLAFVASSGIPDAITHFSRTDVLRIGHVALWWRNWIWASRLRKVWRKLTGHGA